MSGREGLPARALLLDFDGLICDTERAAYRSWVAEYASHGLTFPTPLWRTMMGRDDGEDLALDHLAERATGGRLAVERIRVRRRRLKTHLSAQEQLRPGVAAVLDGAARAGVPVGVVSSSPSTWVETHLRRLGVLDRFAMLVTGDLGVPRKPAPDLYLHALAKLAVPAEEAVAIEDSAVGVRAATAAGIRCVAAPNAVGTAEGSERAWLVLATLEELGLAPAHPGVVLLRGPSPADDHP